MRSNVLVTYKNLLVYAKGLPKDKRDKTVIMIKAGFRNNRYVDDPIQLNEMLQKASSSLGIHICLYV